MHNLIYLKLTTLKEYDPYLSSPEYAHNQWFNLPFHGLAKWLNHVTSRVHQLDTPWSLAPTVCPIPKITSGLIPFDQVLDQIMDQFQQRVRQSGRPVYVAWSGGIDSTTILVSMLKTFDSDLLRDLVVICDQGSINENAYFYHNFIKDRLNTVESDQFEITVQNHDKIIFVDGEIGNQIFVTSPIMTMLEYRRRWDLLDQPWRSLKDLTELTADTGPFATQLIMDSIEHAPIPIETGFDFLWWTGFNFKFDDCLLRKIPQYTRNLDAQQSRHFWEHSLFRPFAQPSMQVWAMLSKDLRRESLKTTVKYQAKKYIHEFDHNDFYFYNKREERSVSRRLFELQGPWIPGISASSMIAIDQDWNKYHIADKSTREILGAILQRNIK